MKNFVLVLLVLVLAGLAGALLFTKGNNAQPENCPAVLGTSCNATDTEEILFYGQGCPHCALVEKFIEDNNIKANFQFDEKEVYGNASSAEVLIKKAQTCGLSLDSLGVPFFWDGPNGKYYGGDKEINCYLKSKISQ